MQSHDRRNGNGFSRTVGRWVFWGFVLIAGYFLVTEHRAHLFGILPYLLVLACPLMHFFHHHGHGGHDKHGDTKAHDASAGTELPRRLDR